MVTRLPRRQAVGLDHYFSDLEINASRYREYATVLLHVLGRKQSRYVALLQKFLRRPALSVKGSLAERDYGGLVRVHSGPICRPV